MNPMMKATKHVYIALAIVAMLFAGQGKADTVVNTVGNDGTGGPTGTLTGGFINSDFGWTHT